MNILCGDVDFKLLLAVKLNPPSYPAFVECLMDRVCDTHMKTGPRAKELPHPEAGKKLLRGGELASCCPIPTACSRASWSLSAAAARRHRRQDARAMPGRAGRAGRARTRMEYRDLRGPVEIREIDGREHPGRRKPPLPSRL